MEQWNHIAMPPVCKTVAEEVEVEVAVGRCTKGRGPTYHKESSEKLMNELDHSLISSWL